MVDFKKLAAPFSPDEIIWRVGSTTQDKKKGMALAYLDARAVMDRLDEVCGPGGWQDRYPHANGKTCCEIGIKVGDEWIWKSDGAGDTDIEGEKGAFSGAFKRAAVRWGIGRYLYDLDAPWVELEPAGRSFKIKASEYSKLRKLLEKREWVGPLGKTKLFDELNRVFRDAKDCQTLEEFETVVSSNEAVLKQAQVDMATEWFGPVPEGRPWCDEFEAIRESLANPKPAKYYLSLPGQKPAGFPTANEFLKGCRDAVKRSPQVLNASNREVLAEILESAPKEHKATVQKVINEIEDLAARDTTAA